jgi:hypothetical protein
MEIETVEIRDRKHVVEVQVVLHQNELDVVIGSEPRRFIPGWEPLEETHARALSQAVDWLKKGKIDLRDTHGRYVART